MTTRFLFDTQTELAPELPADITKLRAPQYGRYLEAFEPGQVFAHPRGYTIDAGTAIAFARTYMQANPLYLNVEYAKAHGFDGLLVSPQQVFNIVLSLGVQNDSEKAMANLGYYNAQFLRPVYAGDTLSAMTEVVDRRERGEGKPGIVHIRTLGKNQHGKVVMQYERKIMVPPQGTRPAASAVQRGEAPNFPWDDSKEIHLPVASEPPVEFRAFTGPLTYFEDFETGQIIVHGNGRSITDEHMTLTYMTANTHPLHYDRVYSSSLSGAMSGEPIVYGGLVFAWLEGLASRDISENALWELGFTEGYHTQPSVSGDTVFAISRVLKTEPAPGDWNENAGIVTVQLIGIKDLRPAQAIETYGAELFEKENDKKKRGKQKISAKIFEIERRLLIKRRPVK